MAVRLKASARTSAEDLLAMQLDAAGWKVVRQFKYALPRRFAADFLVGDVLLVEVQGGVFSRRAHGSIQGVLMDNDRLNAATLAGYPVLRFVPDQVDSGEALNVILQVLATDTR